MEGYKIYKALLYSSREHRTGFQGEPTLISSESSSHKKDHKNGKTRRPRQGFTSYFVGWEGPVRCLDPRGHGGARRSGVPPTLCPGAQGKIVTSQNRAEKRGESRYISRCRGMGKASWCSKRKHKQIRVRREETIWRPERKEEIQWYKTCGNSSLGTLAWRCVIVRCVGNGGTIL